MHFPPPHAACAVIRLLGYRPVCLAAGGELPAAAPRHIILFLTEDQSPRLGCVGCLGTEGLDTPHSGHRPHLLDEGHPIPATARLVGIKDSTLRKAIAAGHPHHPHPPHGHAGPRPRHHPASRRPRRRRIPPPRNRPPLHLSARLIRPRKIKKCAKPFSARIRRSEVNPTFAIRRRNRLISPLLHAGALDFTTSGSQKWLWWRPALSAAWYHPLQIMFLRANKRVKDGKEHRYWSVVESRRVSPGKSVQKTLPYLGEINDSERANWIRAIEAIDESGQPRQINLFPEDRTPDPQLAAPSIWLKLNRIELAKALRDLRR